MVQFLLDRISWLWRVLPHLLLPQALRARYVLTSGLFRDAPKIFQVSHALLPSHVAPLEESSVWLIDWLQRRTNADARILREGLLGAWYEHSD